MYSVIKFFFKSFHRQYFYEQKTYLATDALIKLNFDIPLKFYLIKIKLI